MKKFSLHLLRAAGVSLIHLASMLITGELKSDLLFFQETFVYAGFFLGFYIVAVVGN